MLEKSQRTKNLIVDYAYKCLITGQLINTAVKNFFIVVAHILFKLRVKTMFDCILQDDKNVSKPFFLNGCLVHMETQLILD